MYIFLKLHWHDNYTEVQTQYYTWQTHHVLTPDVIDPIKTERKCIEIDISSQ